MDSLVIATFDGPQKAEDVRRQLLEETAEKLVAPEEAVVVQVGQNREVRLSHTTRLTAPTAISGGFVGILAGLLILNPALMIIGGITGTALGAILGALKEVGIDEDFIENLASEMKPGTSALIVRVRRSEPGGVAEWLKPFAKKVLQTSLAHDDIKRLETALREAEKEHRS